MRGASAEEDTTSIINTRRFKVSTYDTQKTYIEGGVLVEYKNGIIMYREIEVFIKEKNLELKLTLRGDAAIM